MTVTELENRMTAFEFKRWQIFWNINPFGPQRDDHRFGQVCATIAQIGCGKKFNSNDFFPTYEPRTTSKSIKPADGKPFSMKQRSFMAMLQAAGRPKGSDDESNT
ncbi:MAG: hypothetical protein JKY34_07310 [Kordiimonadaceae bacterium]|nr:hypothetical protein [Kordiimonadaceae bacterium]